MRRLGIFVVIAALQFGAALSAADLSEVLSGTLSPDGITGIRKTREGDVEFFDTHSQRGRGLIQRAGEISNISFDASWNADGTNVALLMYYGTKLSTLMIFQRAANGKFVARGFAIPDPIRLFQKKHGSRPFAEKQSGPMANHVGPWIARNTVRLIAGESKIALDRPPPQTEYLFASFDATVSKGHVSVGNVKIHELMTYDEAGQLLGQLGFAR